MLSGGLPVYWILYSGEADIIIIIIIIIIITPTTTTTTTTIIIMYQKWQVKVGYMCTVVLRTVSDSGFLWWAF
jgi:hypothetical protein